MKVFISWSGTRSHVVAQVWHQMLKDMFQTACEPFLSSENISAGFVWFDTLATELDATDVGIICLTPENLEARWIHFEAGALAKKVSRRRVCTYLLGLRPSDIEAPLSAFNANTADKDGTQKVLASINEVLQTPLGETAFQRAFEKWWPEFEQGLSKVPEAESPSPKLRDDRSLIQEALDLIRADTQTLAKLRESVDHVLDFDPEHRMRRMMSDISSTPPAGAKQLEIIFEGGFLGGETRKGTTDFHHDTRFASPLKHPVASIYTLSKGEVGKRVSLGSELSMSLIGAVSQETHQRLMKTAPEDYGFQVYEVTDRQETDEKIVLKMKYVPQSEWANKKT